MNHPYAPQQPAPHAGGPQTWEVGDVIGFGWERFKASWGVLVGIFFVGTFLMRLPGAIPTVMQSAGVFGHDQESVWIGSGLSTLITLFVQPFFMAGFLRSWLAATRGQAPQFGDLFAGGRYYLPLLGVSLLTTLAVLTGYLLLIVPGIILGCGLGFAQFYVVDQNLGAIDAMKASWAATNGHKMKIFLFGIAAFFVVLLGEFACCVGILAAVPVVGIAACAIYLHISGQWQGRPGPMSPVGYGGGPAGAPPVGYGAPPPGGFGSPGYGPPGTPPHQR